MTPPTRPQLPGDPDPLTVEPEPVVPSEPRRIGCSVFVLALLAVASSIVPAPRGASNGSLVMGPVDIGLTRPVPVHSAFLGAPQPARFPEHSGLTDSDVGGAPLLQPAAMSMSEPWPGEPSGYGSTQPVTAVTPTPAPTALVSGFATWCAPTPTKCLGWDGGALLGAMPGYSGHPVAARVCRGSHCIVIAVVSACWCAARHGVATVVDLSPAAFAELAPLDHGVVRVTVTWPVGELPATDTNGGNR